MNLFQRFRSGLIDVLSFSASWVTLWLILLLFLGAFIIGGTALYQVLGGVRNNEFIRIIAVFAFVVSGLIAAVIVAREKTK